MITIEEIKNYMVGKNIITNLAGVFRANNKDFVESESRYHATLKTLRVELPENMKPTLDEYIAACELEGYFPCDEDGKPIMKWIGVQAPGAKKISCDCKKSRMGNLWIDITPKTVVHLLNVYNSKDDRDDYWYQVYTGPLTMEFDYTILKDKRKQLKMTQQEVAEAVGANVRTYQKWENGETTPDGHYLIRLLNWLDISDIQLAIRYNGLD